VATKISVDDYISEGWIMLTDCMLCGNDATGRLVGLDQYCLDCLYEKKFTKEQIQEFTDRNEALAQAMSEMPQDWRTWTPEMVDAISIKAATLMEMKVRVRRNISEKLKQKLGLT
jgi:hypothetical protein